MCRNIPLNSTENRQICTKLWTNWCLQIKVYTIFTASMDDLVLLTGTPQTPPYRKGLIWIYEGLICWKPGWIKVHLSTLTGDKLAHRAHTLRNSQLGCLLNHLLKSLSGAIQNCFHHLSANGFRDDPGVNGGYQAPHLFLRLWSGRLLLPCTNRNLKASVALDVTQGGEVK